MKEIFYELINEAATGKVILNDDEWPVSFNTKIIKDNKELLFLHNDKNLSMLYIKDEDMFFNKLEEYLKEEIKYNRRIPSLEEKDKIKWIMTYLFAYATTEDFNDPINYIQKRIDFLKDNTFNELENPISVQLDSQLLDSILEIKQEKTPITMETPNRILIKLKKDNAIYNLPSIYYAIRNENNKKVCYIYSLLKPKEKPTEEDKKYQKKVNRLLFKINDEISNIEDYNIEGEANIKDVSMSFVFALNIFISLIQKKNIEIVKVVPYLPVSYNARELTAEESSKANELRERNQRIQENQTNKLIRTFRRLSTQNDALQIVSYPYELDTFLTLTISSRNKELNNMLLEESNKKIIEEKTL